MHQHVSWQPVAGLDPVDGLASLVAACRRWFPNAFLNDDPLPECARLEHVFAGLVMLADWIGSDEAFFPFSSDANDRMAFAREKGRDVVRHMGLNVPSEDRRDGLGRDAFARISEFPPTAVQRAILGVPDIATGSINVLESETGSGKTEAALAHFARLFEGGEVDGLYFALPTRTAATQIFQRVTAAAKRAFADPPAVVLAVPGYLRVDEVEGRLLAPFDVLWVDADRDRFRYRGWAAEAPKRYLAGAIVVGTIDQVLLSSLMVRHAHLRATALLRHLLVVDEVHASDAYMIRLLEDVLERHIAAGGHALLLSATLGVEVRHRLLRGSRGGSPVLAINDAIATPYPLISYRDPAVDGRVGEFAASHQGASRSLSVSTEARLEAPAWIAACTLNAAARGAKVLVIRNTVLDCIETQLALESAAGGETPLLFLCRGVAAPHHGRFARDDRRALDDELEKRIGKSRPTGGCAVVATQTVQQSLDIDADFIISDLCPVDVLLQRLGRLHRHSRTRPPGFEVPRAVVLVPENRDLGTLLRDDGRPQNHHGIGSVYDDLRIIEATWRILETLSTWHIPEMNRKLVETGLHSSVLQNVVTQCGDRFRAHQSYLLGQTLGHRRHAELNLVDWTRSYASQAFPARLEERIKTRLGEGDRRVAFDPPLPGPFGLAVHELSVRASMVPGLPHDAEPTAVETDGARIRFLLGEKQFVYDRLGLRIAADHARPSTAEEFHEHGV